MPRGIGWAEVVGGVVGAVCIIAGEIFHDHELVRVGIGFAAGGFGAHALVHHGVGTTRKAGE